MNAHPYHTIQFNPPVILNSCELSKITTDARALDINGNMWKTKQEGWAETMDGTPLPFTSWQQEDSTETTPTLIVPIIQLFIPANIAEKWRENYDENTLIAYRLAPTENSTNR